MVYQFTSHSNLPDNSPCPVHPMFQLYGKAWKGKKLTRQEKDTIADNLYGIWGQQSATYKLGGFLAPFYNVLNKYIVKYKHGHLQEYYAPDKTSLRKALSGGIAYIIEVK